MRAKAATLWVLLAAGMMAGCLGQAQVQGVATHVVDAAGRPVPGATVFLLDSAIHASDQSVADATDGFLARHQVTDGDGQFMMAGGSAGGVWAIRHSDHLPVDLPMGIPDGPVVLHERPGGVVAHRGGADLAPENTLAALWKGFFLGAEMVEVDVRFTRDQALVLMHDRSVDRTTNGTGDVSDHTLEELRRLDAGSWFHTNYTGAVVPTLEEALRVVDHTGLTMMLEVKHPGDPDQSVAAIEVLLRQMALTRQVIITSFERGIADACLARDGLRCGFVLDRPAASSPADPPLPLDNPLVEETEPDWPPVEWLSIPRERADPETLDRLHERGYRVTVWTLNDADSQREAYAAGADSVTSDDPRMALDVLRQMLE